MPIRMTCRKTPMAGRNCKSVSFERPSPSQKHFQVRRFKFSASPLIPDSCVDPPSVAQFSLSALKSLHAVISDDDQYHMYFTSSKALTAAKRRGETRLIEYWSGKPVVSIELLQYVIVRSTRKGLVNSASHVDPRRQDYWLRIPSPYLLSGGRRELPNYHQSPALSSIIPGSL